jgi:hypothetical protein
MAELIYRAGFKNEGLEPVDGSYATQLGALHRIQAPAAPDLVQTLTKVPSADRAVMTVVRPATLAVSSLKDNCYVGAHVQNFPPSIDYFKIRATFEQPEWESPAANFGWAAAIFYRSDRDEGYPYAEERTALTMRSQATDGARSARLNMPDVDKDDVEGGKPGPVPSGVYDCIYESGNPQLSTFTLELLIDRKTFHRARGLLEARELVRSEFPNPSGPLPTPASSRPYTPPGRWFPHPLLTADLESDTNPEPDPARRPRLTQSVGFVLAIASSSDAAKVPAYGKARVMISDFSVYRLSRWEVWLARLGLGWLERLLGGQSR